MWASGACAVHCLLVAWAPNLLVALGLATMATHEVEWGLTLLAFGFASWALVVGWRRHRSWAIAAAFAAGLAGLLAARWLEETGREAGAAVAIFAGGALAIAHMANARAHRLANQ